MLGSDNTSGWQDFLGNSTFYQIVGVSMLVSDSETQTEFLWFVLTTKLMLSRVVELQACRTADDESDSDDDVGGFERSGAE